MLGIPSLQIRVPYHQPTQDECVHRPFRVWCIFHLRLSFSLHRGPRPGISCENLNRGLKMRFFHSCNRYNFLYIEVCLQSVDTILVRSKEHDRMIYLLDLKCNCICKALFCIEHTKESGIILISTRFLFCNVLKQGSRPNNFSDKIFRNIHRTIAGVCNRCIDILTYLPRHWLHRLQTPAPHSRGPFPCPEPREYWRHFAPSPPGWRISPRACICTSFIVRSKHCVNVVYGYDGPPCYQHLVNTYQHLDDFKVRVLNKLHM